MKSIVPLVRLNQGRREQSKRNDQHLGFVTLKITIRTVSLLCLQIAGPLCFVDVNFHSSSMPAISGSELVFQRLRSRFHVIGRQKQMAAAVGGTKCDNYSSNPTLGYVRRGSPYSTPSTLIRLLPKKGYSVCLVSRCLCGGRIKSTLFQNLYLTLIT